MSSKNGDCCLRIAIHGDKNKNADIDDYDDKNKDGNDSESV